MATTGTNRTTTVITSLLVGLVLGWILAQLTRKPAPSGQGTTGPVATPTCVPATVSGNLNIVIESGGIAYPECQTIDSMSTVKWHAYMTDVPLTIEFDDQVFANMTQVGSRWRVNNESTSTCYSGKVALTGKRGSSTTYTYYQTVGTKTVDGRIIINW